MRKNTLLASSAQKRSYSTTKHGRLRTYYHSGDIVATKSMPDLRCAQSWPKPQGDDVLCPIHDERNPDREWRRYAPVPNRAGGAKKELTIMWIAAPVVQWGGSPIIVDVG